MFLLDKIQGNLNGFDAKSLSRARRVTLSKFVLLVVPSYFMLTILLPMGIVKEIERVV